MASFSNITITCTDRTELSAVQYTPESVKAAVLIGPATGIKKTFYHSFALHLAEHGYAVICFDNRGIASSLKGFINDSKANLFDWGQLDMSAVLDRLMQDFPNTTYHLIGHSAGGQLAGLMKNADSLRSIFNFACSSGSLRKMNYPFKFQATFFLNYFIPISNLIFGHTKSQLVGMGEPLPKTVAAQWSKFCNTTGYIKDELDVTIKDHYYDDLAIKAKWLYATDDGIANKETVKDMVRVYPKVSSKILALNPKELGFKDIGHMKYFSRKRKKLWTIATDWLDENR